jgi:diguanylate cyclase (GGDEF)-like protein/PAS domain S-box-containing protein
MCATTPWGAERYRSAGELGRLFDLAPEILCVADLEGVVLLANPAVRTHLGLEPEALYGKPLSSFVLQGDEGIARHLFRGLSVERPTGSAVLRFQVGDTLRRIRWSVRIDPKERLCHAIAWDVTEMQRAQARQDAVLESSPIALLMVDEEGVVVLANNAAERLLRYGKEALIGRSVDQLVPESARGRHAKLRAGFRSYPAPRPIGEGRDLSVVRSDGEVVPVEIGLNPIMLDGAFHAVVSLADISERNRSRERIQGLAQKLRDANEGLEQLAVTDALTGLWNRRKFFEETQRLLGVLQETGGPCSMLIVDLDDFKGLNDTFGHPAGDEVLKQVAHLMRETRQGADIVARLGGEEFIVVMPGAEAVGAVRVAERLRASIQAHPWQLRPLTASVGVATLRDPGRRGSSTSAMVSGMLRAADLALYASKEGGRNRVTHADSLADTNENV